MARATKSAATKRRSAKAKAAKRPGARKTKAKAKTKSKSKGKRKARALVPKRTARALVRKRGARAAPPKPRRRAPRVQRPAVERYDDQQVLAPDAHRGNGPHDRADERAYAERRRLAEGGHDGDARRAGKDRSVEDEGWGRSEGHGRNRLSQTVTFAADDDELNYGRYLGPRDRIPGAGSRRNR